MGRSKFCLRLPSFSTRRPRVAAYSKSKTCLRCQMFSNSFQPRVVLLQLGAAIYVLIRGLDNLKQGWKKRNSGNVNP